ncbi:MAG: radical SAM protein [Candidatus Aminicenantes bacterium]|nr:radical SAM protein [Candidatus Aminicenantes bacterium]
MKASDKNFVKGWYASERDDQGAFRWMSKESVLRFNDFDGPGRKFLRIIAGHSFSDKKLPRLVVFLNGEKIGERAVEAALSPYVFPFLKTGDLTFEFRLDNVFRVENDPRDMGIMLREAELLTALEAGPYLDGWYLPDPLASESIEKSSRWMKQKAGCLFTDLPGNREKYLMIKAGHPYPDEENPVLSVYSGEELVGRRTILSEDSTYYLPLDFFTRDFEIDLSLDRTFPSSVTGDRRTLGILVKDIEIFLPDEMELFYYKGWYDRDSRDFFPYVWTQRQASVFLPSRQLIANRYISFYAYSEFANFRQRLRLELNGIELGEVSLIRNWNFYSFSLPEYTEDTGFRSGHELILSLNRVLPKKYHEDDPRELGIKITPFQFHNDKECHQDFLFFHKNAVLNYKERKQGLTELKSYPINLGIDLFAKCNMKPPCVYCMWDWTKVSEEKYIEDVVDDRTFIEYGPFFRSARLLINCSIGEPLLHPRFEEILNFCQKHNKIMEISTNGQVFTRRTIDALVGKPVFLYISLDAATKETYAKIRNDRWDIIIPKLELLNKERKKKGNLPKIHMVFIPMKVNKDDLEEYFRLCRKIEADALILRPLLVLNAPNIEHDRGGYHFSYKNELLSAEEYEEIFKQCDVYSRKYGVFVANQFSFGMAENGKRRDLRTADLEQQRF